MQVFTSGADSPTASDDHLSELEFSSLQLPEEVLKGIVDAGFRYCTPIQEETLPLALGGRDVAGQAQTGTGKTAAYLVALFCNLANSKPLPAQESAPRA